jgi:CsoR family transcriptional regulator, copper-sensing transcriptional repressor
MSTAHSLHTSHCDKRLLDRLARVEGQVRAVRRMLEEGRSCEDILTQFSAARSSLEGAGVVVLERHIEDCILSAQDVTPESMERLREALTRWSRSASG